VFEDVFERRVDDVAADVEHSVCIAAGAARSAIVHFPGIDDDDLTWCAVVHLAAAPESLNSPKGDPDGMRVVHMAVVYVPLEMCFQQLDTAATRRTVHPIAPRFSRHHSAPVVGSLHF